MAEFDAEALAREHFGNLASKAYEIIPQLTDFATAAYRRGREDAAARISTLEAELRAATEPRPIETGHAGKATSLNYPYLRRRRTKMTIDEFAWLIEAPGPNYLRVREITNVYDFSWTKDANKALRFHSKEQAIATMMALRQAFPEVFAFAIMLGDAQAVEHGWVEAARKPEPERPMLLSMADIIDSHPGGPIEKARAILDLQYKPNATVVEAMRAISPIPVTDGHARIWQAAIQRIREGG